MKVRLLAPDSKQPNIAIMKISTYHKRKGDDVDWYDSDKDFVDTDLLYISKIFTFTPMPDKLPINNCKIEWGGTGIDVEKKLPCEIEEITELDYSLYPDCDYSVIFTTRGCVRNCKFCLVRKKEGLIHNVPICALNPNGKYIKVFDNSFFANPTWRQNLEILKSYNQPLEFSSGIDLRLLTEEQCKELAKCKIKIIHCAWDNYEDKEQILPKLKMLCKYVKPYKISVYVLIGFENYELCDKDIERVKTIWSYGAYPFVMVYRDYNDPNWKRHQSCMNFARWCNNRILFKTCAWEDYDRSYRAKKEDNKNEDCERYYSLFDI